MFSLVRRTEITYKARLRETSWQTTKSNNYHICSSRVSVADIWRERACTLSVEVSQRFHLSRIRPLPLSEAKVGVITNWSQSGLQSPTEINAPRGCAEICIEQRVAQQLFARWCAQALACIFICAPVASCTECFCIIGNSKEFPII